MDLVRVDLHRVLGQMHRHRGITRDDRGQRALVVRIEVLNQHERHAAVGRHVREERLERIQTAGGRPDANDQVRPVSGRRGLRRHPGRARLRLAAGRSTLGGLYLGHFGRGGFGRGGNP